MFQLAVILISLSLGAIFRRTRALPEGTHRVLNAIVVHVSLPALTLLHLHQLPIDTRAIFPILMAWILFIVGGAFIYLVGKWRGWNGRTIGAVILTGALANTSFVGFPMLEALFGREALPIGILTDQPGSFLVLSTLAVAVASLSANRGHSPRHTVRRILTFPPFYAMLAALALSPIDYSPLVTKTLERFSDTLVPLALLSMGFQLEINRERLSFFAPQICLGLVFKLILGPAAIAALYMGVFGLRGQDISISIVQAAMPPMILGAVLACEYDLEPALANLMVGIGIPLSFLTVPAWFWLLQNIG